MPEHGVQRPVQVMHHQGNQSETITRKECGAFLILHMANIAEQSAERDASPGFWLSAVSQWGVLARALTNQAPPILDQCAARLSEAEERQGRERYLEGLASFEKDSWLKGKSVQDSGIRCESRSCSYRTKFTNIGLTYGI